MLGEVVLDTLDAQGLSGCERERLERWSQKEEETGRGEKAQRKPLTETETYTEAKR